MKLLSLLFFSCAAFICNGQVNARLSARITDTVVIKKFEPTETAFKWQKLHMQPGDHRIQNEVIVRLLKNETITGIDLVYSDFPEGEDFTELNRRRMLELYAVLPEAFNHQVVKWRVIKQTGVKKTGDINNYFHGFVVYYRPMPTFAAENKLIEDIVEGRVKPQDSTLLKVFERNDQWKDMLVVCDVTGSMSPYTAQLLLWIKANQKLRNMKDILFFNDDDSKSTAQTKDDDPTGMWSVSSGNYKKVMEVALEAMQKGQHIENNLEAICSAVKKYPDGKKKVVMIADNWEDPCDLSLLNYLETNQIPVRIIVCGVNASFNMKYLDIARATGGTVHTMEQDLTNLASMKDGTKFTIGDVKIMLSKGKFYQLN